MKTPAKSPFVIAPDATTARHVARSMTAVDSARVFDGSRGWAVRARRSLEGEEAPILVIAPGSSLGVAQLDLARFVSDRSGVAIAWRSTSNGADADDSTGRACLLLAQHRTLLFDDLAALSCVADILSVFPGALAALALPPRGRDRVSTLVRGAMAPAATGRKAAAAVKVHSSGAISIDARGESVDLRDAATAARALRAIGDRFSSVPNLGFATPSAPRIDEDVISLIVQPPARLLSETASKRLCAAFDILPGEERLCGSSSEAVRFAADLGGPVLLKLVRPQMDDKTKNDAVHGPLRGSAAVRRAYHALEALGVELSPPPPLGILVTRHYAQGPRLWLSIEDDPVFGRLIVGALGDPLAEPGPSIALRTPLSFDDAAFAIGRSFPTLGAPLRASLATGLHRFAGMAERLGGAVDRADVHLLACRADTAIAVDATISITNGGDQ